MSRTSALLPALAMSALFPGMALAQTVGVASWYGGRHDGLRTSSGAIFDQEGMTAASRSIPLGSRVRVTMAETGQSVVVVVNDRMGGRTAIIDLSKGAARQIGLLGRGRGMVSIDAADNAPIEVAEATEDETGDLSGVASDFSNASRRGRRHTRHGSRSVAAAHRCCHAPSVILARHSVQHRVVQRRL
jgi:rare lipoprotein A